MVRDSYLAAFLSDRYSRRDARHRSGFVVDIMKYVSRSRSSLGIAGIGSQQAQRVTILGMARQGMALARYFLGQGARVTLSDLRPAASLAATCDELSTWAAASGRRPDDLRFILGEHPLELLRDTDLLCLSGGVAPTIPIAQAAIARGIPLSNDSLLALQNCPVPIIGITGSAGKTTTTTLAGQMLEQAGYRVHIGGNIGVPLIDKLESIAAGDKVVMELSSFQLELCDSSPAIAAILNITPNHLDRHPSMSHYAAAKANLLRFQVPGDTCVLNADDPFTGPWLHSGRCTIEAGEGQAALEFPLRADRLAFSLAGEVEAGAFLREDALIWRVPGMPDALVCRVSEVRLRGRHNLANVLAASCLAGAARRGPGCHGSHSDLLCRGRTQVGDRSPTQRDRVG